MLWCVEDEVRGQGERRQFLNRDPITVRDERA